MELKGIVTGGSAKASALGFPTANIPLPKGTASGVYASTVVFDGAEHKAVSYADPSRGILESHLFDFSGNLYGKNIVVTLHSRIREPEAFENDAELIAAITADADAARRHHKST